MLSRASSTPSSRAPRSFPTSLHTRHAVCSVRPRVRARGIPMTLSSEGSGLSINRAMRMMQFSDSMFPVGSFSFSNGLESAVAQGIVTGGPSLREFVLSAAHQGATCDGIAVLAAHRGAAAGDFSAILAADHAVIERKLNEEARTMSTRMGKKLAELGGRLAGE